MLKDDEDHTIPRSREKKNPDLQVYTGEIRAAQQSLVEIRSRQMDFVTWYLLQGL